MKLLFLILFSALSLFGFENLTKDNFDEKIQNKNVIVDFYATWCPPCKIISVNLKEFDEMKTNDVVIYKVDIDNQMPLARKYEISKLPSILFLKNGIVKDLQYGVLSSEEINKLSIKHFGK